MNCEQCQELISVYLDNELEEKVCSDVQTHLSLCAECAKVCEDFAMILDFCDLEESEYPPPPNSKALWCRINNLIETEIAPELEREAAIKEGKKRKSWQFSFSQVFASIMAIALFSSLLTIVSIKNFYAAGEVSVNTEPSLFDRALGKVGLIETPQQSRERRVKEQQAAIEILREAIRLPDESYPEHVNRLVAWEGCSALIFIARRLALAVCHRTSSLPSSLTNQTAMPSFPIARAASFTWRRWMGVSGKAMATLTATSSRCRSFNALSRAFAT